MLKSPRSDFQQFKKVVNYIPKFAGAGAHVEMEKREDDGSMKELVHKPKKTSHHRLPLNHVFHPETKFFFKIDVSYTVV